MKNLIKILACMSCAICMLTLVGCKKVLNGEEVTIDTAIDSNATIKANGREYKAKIFSSPEGIGSITLTSPEGVAGISFTCKDGKCEISRKNLVGTFTPMPLEKDSFVRIILDFLGGINNAENFQFIENQGEARAYEGKISDKGVKILTNSEGKMLSVEVPEENILINFE